MSNRKATVEQIFLIEKHPNADALELVEVLGYQCVARKGQFKEREWVVIIPEQTIIPEYLLKQLGLWDEAKQKGKLAGPEGNRMKVTKLRGEASHGLLVPFGIHGAITNEENSILRLEDTYAGEDVSEFLGIKKWNPEIPTQMSGEVCSVAGKTLNYDIENVKNYSAILDSAITLGLSCAITEKLHGTWCCFGYYPNAHPKIPDGNWIVTSKGLSGKGLAFMDNEANENNIYMKMFKGMAGKLDRIKDVIRDHINYDGPVYILGEIYGKGVQDLTYGSPIMIFRAFDIYVGTPSDGRYLPYKEMRDIFDREDFEMVPELYTGPLKHELVRKYTNGTDSISGSHMREGIVIRPFDIELSDSSIGRFIIKSISDDYLARKGGTEHN